MSSDNTNKLEEVKEAMTKDLLAADLMLSIVHSAAISFKRDSLLVPFPKFYLNSDGSKNFDKLSADLEKLPNLEEFLVLLYAENSSLIYRGLTDLLHFSLYSKYQIQHVADRKLCDEILSLSKGEKITSKPTHYFSVNYVDSNAERKFQQLATGNTTKFAYHGTKFSNIYSILSHGLQQHLNKTGIFGEGLYLSQEIDVSLLFSPAVLSWKESKLGDTVSCVAVCEYIDDPQYVKIRKENAKNSDIPQSYLLITNNEYVRVRHLLIYGSKKSSAKEKKSRPATSTQVVQQKSFMKWCRRNPMIVSVVLYFLMLFLVGFSNNRAVEYYKNNLINFFKNRFKFL